MSKYIFLDRDGTIIEDRGYVYKTKDLKFLPGTVSVLKKLQKLGYKFIIITNQAGIARGLYTLKDADKFNYELKSRLAAFGIKIEKIYLCPHHPDFTGNCSCRKPKTGLAKLAAKELGVKLSDGIFIGDKDSDTGLGRNCKAVTILIKNGQYQNKIRADFETSNLKEAAEILRRFQNHFRSEIPDF